RPRRPRQATHGQVPPRPRPPHRAAICVSSAPRAPNGWAEVSCPRHSIAGHERSGGKGKIKMAQHYELVAIGAGPAGESAAVMAATFGHRTVVVERDSPGGTVTTTGGTPTKTLREAAMYLTGFRDREVYGISVTAPPEVVLPKIAERTRQVCALL